jgi:hypothetical protein
MQGARTLVRTNIGTFPSRIEGLRKSKSALNWIMDYWQVCIASRRVSEEMCVTG